MTDLENAGFSNTDTNASPLRFSQPLTLRHLQKRSATKIANGLSAKILPVHPANSLGCKMVKSL